MNSYDHVFKRELHCKAYLLYVDDFALFSDSKTQLQEWRQRIIRKLACCRLKIHENACQVTPVTQGNPWLGMVIYSEKRKLKARKARYTTRHLKTRYTAWKNAEISFAEQDAWVKG